MDSGVGMDKRAGQAVLGIGAVALGIWGLTRLRKKAPPEPPPPPPLGYTCIFGDGFTAATWAEMWQHYVTVHPEELVSPIEIVWY